MASSFSTLQMMSDDSNSDSISDSSSDLSLSPSSSTSSVPSPRCAFANPISIPLKSLLSPPSTSTTSSTFSLSPATPMLPTSNSSAAYAYPSWPNRDFLSLASSTAFVYGSLNCTTNSHISDEDLLDLEKLDLYGDVRIPAGMIAGANGITTGISWEATRQPPVVLPSLPLPKVSAKKRGRSSPLKRKKTVKGLSPITEGPE